ncbi:MAG: hypothetical protein EXR72_25225 [Myxococcales bacterium]|nr:hypothetical protein [Myxococcales bacterium]
MLRLLFATLTALAIVGCTQPCDQQHLCALDGDRAICDGTHFRPCDDATRAEVVPCVTSPRIAVCTPSGWTFQSTPRGNGP